MNAKNITIGSVIIALVLVASGLAAGKQIADLNPFATKKYVDDKVLLVDRDITVLKRNQLHIGLQVLGGNIARAEIDQIGVEDRLARDPDNPDARRIKRIIDEQLKQLRIDRDLARCELRRLDHPQAPC